MRHITIAVLFVVAFALGGAVTWFAFHLSPSPAAASSSDKAVLYWYDPMVPQQHFNAPGKSPFMDMQLVPKYAGESGVDTGTVRIDPRLTQNLGVRTARAERGTLAHVVRATGSLAFDERSISVVQSRVAGIVEKLWVRTPLSTVKRGQPLVTVIAPDWTSAQEEYLSLRRAKTSGLEDLRSAARQRLLLIGMDDAQIRDVERTARAQTRITIAAPRDGVITDLAVREGASLMAGAPLLTLNGVDTLWLNAAITESDSSRVVAGATATITLAAFPGESFSGAVETLLPDVDPVTRTQRARIVLSNPKARLASGMLANVEIAPVAPSHDTVLIPSEAVIVTGTRSVVIVDVGQGRFRAQEVRLGQEASGKSEVLEGIAAGDTVVLSGQYLIDSEASLSGTLARLGEDTSPPAASTEPPGMQSAQYVATGVVRGIDGHRWTIATDAVASLDMEAMTMTFVCPAATPAGDIRVGQHVSFSFFRNDAGQFQIAKIAVRDDEPAKDHRP